MHNQYYKRKTKQKGFSLIEIMTVITIIGILLALSTLTFTRVRQNTANKNRETQAKTLAAALENAARYDETVLNCTEITKAPEITAARLELKPADVADVDNPAVTRISCAKKTRPATSDSFFVSGLGCPEIRVEFKKDGSSERGFVTAKGPLEAGQTCITPNPDSV